MSATENTASSHFMFLHSSALMAVAFLALWAEHAEPAAAFLCAAQEPEPEEEIKAALEPVALLLPQPLEADAEDEDEDALSWSQATETEATPATTARAAA